MSMFITCCIDDEFVKFLFTGSSREWKGEVDQRVSATDVEGGWERNHGGRWNS